MKHATPSALDQLDELLAALRKMAALKEKRRGVFYVKSQAFLHFHEDPAGFFADLRSSADWERYPVNTAGERRSLLDAVRRKLPS